MDIIDLLGVAAPAILGAANIALERRENELSAARKRGAGPRPALLELQAVPRDSATPGALVSLGTSIESPDSISNHPVLTTEEIGFVSSTGARFHVEAGQKLRIVAFPGAERPLRRTVTTQEGVEQHYGMEIRPERAVWILAEGPAARSADGARDAAGPFRGEPSTPLVPWGPSIAVASTREALEKDSAEGSSVVIAVWVGAPMATLSVIAALGFLPIWIFWVAMALGVFWLGITLIPHTPPK